MGRRWQTALGLLLSLGLIYWVLHDVALAELWAHIRAANLWLLGLAVAVQTSTFLLRALRWRIFLAPAIAHTRLRNRFATTCVGFMANNLLPARVGEFARAYALARTEPVTVSTSFGSLVVERIFDGVVLAGFLVLTVLLPGFPAAALRSGVVGQIALAAAAIGLLAVLLVAVLTRPRMAVALFRRTVGRLLPAPAAERIAEIIASFITGLGALRRPELILSGLLWTIVLWAWGAVAYLIGMRAFGILEPGYTGSVFLQSVNAFAVAVPSSPGFFGPFEASVRLALAPFQIEAARAASFAIAFHVGGFVPVTALGLWYMGRLGLSWGEVEHSEELVEESGEPSPSPERLAR